MWVEICDSGVSPINHLVNDQVLSHSMSGCLDAILHRLSKRNPSTSTIYLSSHKVFKEYFIPKF